MDSLLKVSDLRVSFPSRTGWMEVVSNLSFQIQPSEIVGLVGESGSGKSMTGLSLMRLIAPPGRAQGSILWKGSEEILTMPPRRLRSLRGAEIAMIFQDPFTSLNPLMTVGAQIAENVQLHQNLKGKAAWNQAVEMLERVHLPSPETLAKRYPHQLSGGQRQRVMIAMAFVCQPALLIADEPTTALDVTLQVQILALLKELRDQFKTAILLISHDFGVIGAVCQRVMVMYAGRLVETGSARDTLGAPLHPYTQALLESLPMPGTIPQPIPGQPPEPSRRPDGCAFHPRCRFAFDRCSQNTPALLQLGGEQQAACFLREREQKHL